MRLGIFGGTFDPVHFGHLLLAERCREACQLDQVWFMPAAQAPHKQATAPTASKDRLAMLELALSENPAFEVSRLELDRGGVSYTLDTLQRIQAVQPKAELFLLMGADSLFDMPNWRGPREILRLATPVCVVRPGSPPPDYDVLAGLTDPERLALFRAYSAEMPAIDISSTEIRARAAAGQSLRYLTPTAVVDYIGEHRLYA